MNRTITLEQALQVWSQWKTAQEETTGHFSTGELHEFLFHPLESPNREEILQHLRVCPTCLAEFTALDRCREDEEALGGWDIALPIAAAAPAAGPRRITTESGRYTIHITSKEKDPSRGLIIVRVSSGDSEALEGALLTLRDGNNRILIDTGRISGGEVAKEIENLDKIEHSFVVHVQPMKS